MAGTRKLSKAPALERSWLSHHFGMRPRKSGIAWVKRQNQQLERGPFFGPGCHAAGSARSGAPPGQRNSRSISMTIGGVTRATYMLSMPKGSPARYHAVVVADAPMSPHVA